jgi:hypothetical protein
MRRLAMIVGLLLVRCATGRPELIALGIDEVGPPTEVAMLGPIPVAAGESPFRLFRSYYEVIRVTEVREHYVASYRTLEPNTLVISIDDDGSDLVVDGGGWGGAASDPVADRYRPEHARAVAAIRALIETYQGTHVGIAHVGTHRDIDVIEHVEYLTARGELAHSTYVLRFSSDEGLGQLSLLGPVGASMDHHGCVGADCPVRRWIDLRTDLEGYFRLPAIFSNEDNSLSDAKARQTSAILAAAKSLLDRAEVVPFDSLSASREVSLLPEHLDDTIGIILELLEDDPTRLAPGAYVRSLGRGELRASLGAALSSSARSTATFTTPGGPLTLEVGLTASPIEGTPTVGRTALEVKIEYRISGADRPAHGTIRRQLAVLRDGPRVMPLPPQKHLREARPLITPLEVTAFEVPDRLYVVVRTRD